MIVPLQENAEEALVINCGRSSEMQYADKDLLELGEGKKPSNMVQLENEFISNKSLSWISIVLLLILTLSIISLFRKVKVL